MNAIMAKIFGRKGGEHYSEPFEQPEVDPVIARDFDAALVEFGLLTVEDFNEAHPDQPFIPEEIYENRDRQE